MRSPKGHPFVAAIIDFFMAPFEGIRRKVVPHATGRVLEIGIGTGMNGPIYELDHVEALVGIEPDPHMLVRARRRYEELGLDVEIVQCGAEDMPFEDASFDTLVLTFTLCTIPDAEGAVREMYRVLKPGGKLIFAEHTASDHRAMRAMQNAVNPVWGVFSGGCNLNRDAVAMLTAGGFELEELHGHGREATNPSPVHRGVAVKPG